MNTVLGIPLLILIGILLLFSAFFSASETSLIALSKIRLRHLVSKGIKGAAGVQRLISKIDKVIAAVLIGNNLVNIAISAIVTTIFLSVFDPRWAIFISTLFVTFIVLIFGEITPKTLAIKYTEKMSLIVAPFMEVTIRILHPLIRFFTFISDLILKILRIEPAKRSPLITEEEIRLMLELGKDEGVLSEDEIKMLHRIFEFGDTEVATVMIPKEKMVAININASPETLLNILTEEGHSRIPVYKDSVDNIAGIIYARDLLYIWRNKELFTVADLVHAPYFVKPNTKVNVLLREFQKNRIQIAVVADEKNKTKGLVTLEDLLEEIVGEIEEETHLHTLKNNKVV